MVIAFDIFYSCLFCLLLIYWFFPVYCFQKHDGQHLNVTAILNVFKALLGTGNYSREYKRDDTEKEKKLNIILMMTDDQDAVLGSLKYMPNLRRFIQNQGTTFSRGYVTTPMCCPSRSSILTGMYARHHNVLTNRENCSSTEWIEYHEPRTFAPYLKEAGYHTGYIGKYLNRYDGLRVPVGWDEWIGLIRNSKYYNYSLNVNGQKKLHGFNYAEDYLPDLITNKSISFIQRAALKLIDQPFLLVMSFPAPHGPEDSSPKFSHLFANVADHHTPSYDFSYNEGKEKFIREMPLMKPIHKRFTDALMQKRLQTLQSVDDSIKLIHQVLDETKQLDNTYIFYTSDHGYHLGQFGVPKGKGLPYEFDIRVPFFVKGPGVFCKHTIHKPVLNIDLAPTFLDIANIKKPIHMDGNSILPILLEHSKDDINWRDSFVIERGIMTTDLYVRHLHAALKQSSPLIRASAQCDLNFECQKTKYQQPCQLRQQWYCKSFLSQNEVNNVYWKAFRCSARLRRKSKPCKRDLRKNNFDAAKNPWHLTCKNLSKHRNSRFPSTTEDYQKCQDKLKTSNQTVKKFGLKYNFDLEIKKRICNASHCQRKKQVRNAKLKCYGNGDCRRRRRMLARYRNSRCLLHSFRLNCFWFSSTHWRTPPFWTEGPFCACTNSKRNTYSCLRKINKFEDFLYCEYVTGYFSFYDLKQDPHQLSNVYANLSCVKKENLHIQLEEQKKN